MNTNYTKMETFHFEIVIIFIQVMEDDEIFSEYIHHIQVHERANEIILGIQKNGEFISKIDNIPRSVHSITASIRREVNTFFNGASQIQQISAWH